MPEETERAVEYGKDAHRRTVESARYVVAPDGRLVLLQRHLPLKVGWREATPEEVIRAELRARDLEQLAAADKALADRLAVEESERKDIEERARRAENAARAAAKAALQPQKLLTAPEPPVDDDEPAETTEVTFDDVLQASAVKAALIGDDRDVDEVIVTMEVRTGEG